MHKKDRSRVLYFILAIFVIALGLASRKYAHFLPAFIGQYAGDTLWGLMVFLIIAFIFNKRPSLHIAAAAMLFSTSIELSQLYQADWINALRNTIIGGLVLGFGFLWRDILCYFIGILFGFTLDQRLNKDRRKKYDF